MKIEPFRGYRYVGGGRDLSAVVAPPYDQIHPETLDRLYRMSPWNIARATCPRDEAGADKYRHARSVLDSWLAAGAWAKDATPAIYPYDQTYVVAGRTVARTGFVALGEVTEYARGVVLPHERTHAGVRRDRLDLLEATRADMGLLFMLVADPSGQLRQATAPLGEPIAEARDLQDERHRLWRVTDPAMLAHVQALMAARSVIIADGHHRYETAVEYARRHPDARTKLMGFFALEAPGLTIFPNHRLVHDVPDFSFGRLLDAAARRWFDVAPLGDPASFRPTNRTIGAVAGAEAVRLTLRADAFDRIPWPAGTSRAWRELAVSILHEGLLRPLLDITDEKLDARTRVDYTASQEEAVTLAREGHYQAAFIIAPTTPDELQAVVRGGELLPQKSTHFYPKLLDGLVFHRID
ncbi:MAG: DUF1015 domain-containing protein [Candidatus Rokuibacteriota bacterium]